MRENEEISVFHGTWKSLETFSSCILWNQCGSAAEIHKIIDEHRAGVWRLLFEQSSSLVFIDKELMLREIEVTGLRSLS